MIEHPAPRMKLAIIIIAYNEPALVKRCLTSLGQGAGVEFLVFLIDNSTTDEVGDALAADSRVQYQRTPENLGFCGANNIGIEAALAAGAEYVLLLNHDTVLADGCLDKLLARADALGGGSIVTCKIRLMPEDGRLWYGGGYFSRIIGAGKNRGFYEVDRGQFDDPCEVTYATGCCLLVPSEAFRRAGLLKTSLFMYLDDIEFCLRARAAGFRIFYEPGAVVYHELGSGATLRRRPDYYLYFSIRNKPLVAGGAAYRIYLHILALVFAAVKALQFGLLPGMPQRARKVKAIAWGAWDSLVPGNRYQRRFPGLFRASTSPFHKGMS